MGELDVFLSVEKSLSGKRWVSRLDQAGLNRALTISQKHGIQDITARILAGRGVSVDEASTFLEPSIKSLMPDPYSLTDMDKAAKRLLQAVLSKENVAIFGDYDVDGACSSALVKKFLDHFGVPAEIYIPDRIFEGYGPNEKAIAGLIDNGANLIITVDCGSTSFDALEVAAARGVDVLIIDHHQVNDKLPTCHALVNPNRQDDLSGQGHLCAAGVVFLFLVASLGKLREQKVAGTELLNMLAMLDLVGLATVCDVVPLVGVNRAFVVKGLVAARHLGNKGLTALLKIAKIDGPVTAYHFGYILGPRINAGGRIGDAGLGSRLLCCDEENEAEAISLRLDELNQERQLMEKTMLEEAEAEAFVEMQNGDGPDVIITEKDKWHSGIVGLVAARLKEKYSRPAFAIAFDANDKGTGSGRSIYGFDIGKMVREAVDQGVLVKGGGHAMAAGITVERSKLGELRSFFEEKAMGKIKPLLEHEVFKVDGALSASGATREFVGHIEKVGPFGSGHSQPVFAFPAHRLADCRVVGQGHLKFRIQNTATRTSLDGIAFRAEDSEMGRALLAGRGKNFHFAGTLGLNFWNGRETVQIVLRDAALAN